MANQQLAGNFRNRCVLQNIQIFPPRKPETSHDKLDWMTIFLEIKTFIFLHHYSGWVKDNRKSALNYPNHSKRPRVNIFLVMNCKMPINTFCFVDIFIYRALILNEIAKQPHCLSGVQKVLTWITHTVIFLLVETHNYLLYWYNLV